MDNSDIYEYRFEELITSVDHWVAFGLLSLICGNMIKESFSPEEEMNDDFGVKTMLLLAVTLHNIPEGMAVGVVYAGLLTGSGVPFGAALALAIGIAIQNFPEGAIISLPLRSAGESRWRAFVNGVLSGAVEPVGAALAIAAASFVVPVLPYFLSFAAGAMLYVVVEELIPEMSEGEHSDIGVLSFAVGFTLMMALDVALG